ncbi:MAG: Hsp20/alpha crystallin family protein [Deferribacteraceae bacterium]|jgi:HSP20 family molecular chaperone IbpA|nr:Hsp20/alpha crystallin family protein [Deferribacteraceae bacterium]
MHFKLQDFKSFLVDENQEQQLGGKLNVPMDVVINPGSVHMWLDLPGILATDVRVYRRDDYIVIEGVKRSYYSADKSRVFVRMERQSAHFQRILHIPVSETIENIQFDLNDGVLHIMWER